MRYTAPDKGFIKEAFNSISPQYDLLNQVLSFAQADGWRKRACKILLKGTGSPLKAGRLSPLDDKEGQQPLKIGTVPAQAILDLGCGTGDSLKWFLKAKKWEQAVGLDFAHAMLDRAVKKIPGATFISGDFHHLPFGYGSFDLVFSAFTLRSVQNMPQFLGEIKRVLKSGGRVGLLELTRPRNFLHKIFFLPYLKAVLPVVGWLVSGNGTAYRFLSQSVENFQTPDRTLELMRQAGFRDLSTKSFSFGAATLMIGAK